MKLENYISELLGNHNCVIVPDFGGFIANYKSAVIDGSRKMIHPPSKSILFNKNLINNDGLLANAISENESIAYNQALIKVQKSVSEWKMSLKEGGRIEIGEIGFLCQQNGQVFFEQNREVNLLLDAYGLSSINFVTFNLEQKVDESAKVERTQKIQKPTLKIEKEKLETETPVIKLDSKAKIETVVEEQDEKIIPLQPKSKKWKYIAAAVAIPFLFYSYWIPMETDFLDTGQIQFSDFNPIHTQKTRVYETRENDFNYDFNEEVLSWESLTETLSENVRVYNYQFDEELYIPVRLTTEVVLDNEIVEVQENVYNDSDYYIIGGCFSVENNANNMVSELKENGFSARILDKNNGLHRVTTGGFSSKSDADAALENLRNKGFSGWILSM